MPTPQIMIVEDERIIAMDIRARLQKLGYQVSAVVGSGRQAIQKAQELHPDLVLMDIRLEGEMDGVEAAEQLRTHLDVPVIYLTAYADDETLNRARVTEPYGYLLKPFEEHEIRSTVEIALYKHAMALKLRESQRWLATTLKSIGDAVIATDAQGRIKFMNPIAEGLTGWRESEALDQDVSRVLIVLDEDSGTVLENPAFQVLRQDGIVGLPDHCSLLTREGNTIPINDSASPIRDDIGHLAGVVFVFRDITARRRAEAALARHTRDLEERNEELDAFADAVANGLRRPLTYLVQQAEELAERHAGLPDDLVAGHLQAMARRGQAMSRILDEMALLARVRNAQVKPESVEMGQIIAAAQRRLAGTIDQYQARIVGPPTWPAALGHRPWLEEVWLRYLGYALELGGQPPRVVLGADPATNGMVRYWVQDNGPGLRPEALARRFGTAHRREEQGPVPDGLGFVLVRRMVERLGGRACVESSATPGNGCIFSFTLRAVPSSSPDRSEDA
jgi:PAS domain S-box-containing protein